MNHKSILVLMAISLITTTLSAQTTIPPGRIHEPGISFTSLNGFGITYKTGSEKTLFRIKTALLNMNFGGSKNTNNSSTHETKNTQLGVGFALGFERRIPIAGNFFFSSGLDLSGTYTWGRSKPDGTGWITENSGFITGLGVVIGFGVAIKSKVVISAEIVPGIFYTWVKYTESQTGSTDTETINQSQNLGFSFNSNSAGITVAYRFGK